MGYATQPSLNKPTLQQLVLWGIMATTIAYSSVHQVTGQEISGLKSRMDDMHRLMMVLIGIAGGGLVSGARESRAAIAEVDGRTTAILPILLVPA